MKCAGHLWQEDLPCATPGCERGVDGPDLRVAETPRRPAPWEAWAPTREPDYYIRRYRRWRVNEVDWIWVEDK